jgi:hypothetical protein
LLQQPGFQGDPTLSAGDRRTIRGDLSVGVVDAWVAGARSQPYAGDPLDGDPFTRGSASTLAQPGHQFDDPTRSLNYDTPPSADPFAASYGNPFDDAPENRRDSGSSY